MLHSCASTSLPVSSSALGGTQLVAPLQRRRVGVPLDIPAPLPVERLDVRLPTAALLHRAGHTAVVGVGLRPRPLHKEVQVNTVEVFAVTRVARVRRLGERCRGWIPCVARVDVVEEVELSPALSTQTLVSRLLQHGWLESFWTWHLPLRKNCPLYPGTSPWCSGCFLR